jgi:hypothetical protein
MKASFPVETSVPYTTKRRQNPENEQYKRCVEGIVNAGLIYVVDIADSFCSSGHEYSRSRKGVRLKSRTTVVKSRLR